MAQTLPWYFSRISPSFSSHFGISLPPTLLFLPNLFPMLTIPLIKLVRSRYPSLAARAVEKRTCFHAHGIPGAPAKLKNVSEKVSVCHGAHESAIAMVKSFYEKRLIVDIFVNL